MTAEEKQLLLKDICARLSYHNLWMQYDNKDWLAIGYGHGRIELLTNPVSSATGPCPLIEEIKPYLRPMSSMTEEEKEELYHYYCKEIADNLSTPNLTWELRCCVSNSFGTDWLNAHYFDYRGLIPMGLALEAPEGMYKTE